MGTVPFRPMVVRDRVRLQLDRRIPVGVANASLRTLGPRGIQLVLGAVSADAMAQNRLLRAETLLQRERDLLLTPATQSIVAVLQRQQHEPAFKDCRSASWRRQAPQHRPVAGGGFAAASGDSEIVASKPRDRPGDAPINVPDESPGDVADESSTGRWRVSHTAGASQCTGPKSAHEPARSRGAAIRTA